MEIRKATLRDLDTQMGVLEYAKTFMRRVGNKSQWVNGYPSAEIIMNDIANGNSYVCVNEENEMIATFCFFQGEEPNYAQIEDGQWLNDKSYGVVHRLAGNGKVKGVGTYCLDWCYAQCSNIRVDTHQENQVMQSLLKKNGFIPCGIIYVSDGTPRIAFQKC